MFLSEGEIIFIMLNTKQTLPPAPERNTISNFQNCLLYKHPWKDSEE